MYKLCGEIRAPKAKQKSLQEPEKRQIDIKERTIRLTIGSSVIKVEVRRQWTNTYKSGEGK